MVNIILIICLSLSFQIHVVIFFVPIVNNVKSLYFYPNPHSNMQQSKKFRPFLNIMYVKCINMITLRMIPSVNLRT
jgi:energy-converting hydrogenase Eha subunit F